MRLSNFNLLNKENEYFKNPKSVHNVKLGITNSLVLTKIYFIFNSIKY